MSCLLPRFPAAIFPRSKGGWIAIRTEQGPGQAGVVLEPEHGIWNLEGFAEIAVPVRNTGNENLRIILRVDDYLPGRGAVLADHLTRRQASVTSRREICLHGRAATGDDRPSRAKDWTDFASGTVIETALTRAPSTGGTETYGNRCTPGRED